MSDERAQYEDFTEGEAIEELACVVSHFCKFHPAGEKEAHDRMERVRIAFGADHLVEHRQKRETAEAARMSEEEARKKKEDDARQKLESQSGEIAALRKELDAMKAKDAERSAAEKKEDAFAELRRQLDELKAKVAAK